MSILDFLSGGQSKSARNALNEAKDIFARLKLPSIAELTLPELEKYVNAGILTPEQAQAVLIQGNAYNDINVDPSTIDAQQDVISKFKGISDSKGMTDTMKARLTEALDQVATNERGSRASISDQFAQKGIPSSLMAEAAMREEAGSNARNANLSATQAAGDAEARAMEALKGEGNVAAGLRGQLYNEQAQKAQAENAIRQWNAGAATNVNEANAGRGQQANIYNTTTNQGISNANTELGNKRTEYNAALPQQVYENALRKASGEAGAATNIGNLAQNQGKQQVGINSGIIAAAAKGVAGMGGAPSAPAGYNPNMSEDMLPGGGFAEGGKVPGTPTVPGDSPKNDKVHAMLSPGEIVVPRSIAPNPDAVKRFVQHLAYQKNQKPVHPDDVNVVLEALSKRRGPISVGSNRG